MLKVEDSRLQVKVSRFLKRWFRIPARYPPRSEDPCIAWFGFDALGEKAAPAIPELLRLLEKARPPIKKNILNAINSIGPVHAPPKNLVHSLISYLTDPDAEIRDSAVRALSVCHADSHLAVSALLHCLDESRRPLFRLQTVFQSLELLSQEPEVVSAIEKFLNDPDHRIVYAARETLERMRAAGAN
jgi:HEAT repeat protein